MTEITISERARKLYADALVWDTHSGFMPDPVADLNNLQIWRDAGVNYLSIDVGFDLMSWQDTVRTLAAFRRWINAHPEHYTLVTSADEALQAKAQGKLAITFDLEGMNALDGRIEMVEFYHHLGVRQMLFAYNRNNLAGGGCHDDDSGLTAFGRQVIDEMNRLGMFVDVTHCGHRTTMDVMEYSDRPVIFSHSNPKVLCGHGRNITDDQIRACAKTGGIVGIVGLSKFLGDDKASSDSLADHVEYLLDVAGPAHVGIGLDYAFPVDMAGIQEILAANPQFWPLSEGYGTTPTVYAEPAQLAEMTEILLRRGHADETVRGVLGGNFLRLARQVWK
ncbi:Membrane dipeptidase (Peptidase family M19) [Aminobacter sp. MSH1]|uniref:dipeptidase n=1 Tax=Aminobacter sp. MSH1 TaxID=374606 RepID=UPI000D5053FF|nr:dipeptidase [Aminobacter sp. MSH1]AWC24047.1 Membrane dipeptidase (Peptidase family M19) [Aminobacter sp. MSH1]